MADAEAPLLIGNTPKTACQRAQLSTWRQVSALEALVLWQSESKTQIVTELECQHFPSVEIWLTELRSWWANRILPSNSPDISLGKYRVQPYDITIGSDPSASYGNYGSWMCLWPRQTWTMHLFSGVATLQQQCNPLQLLCALNNTSFQWGCNLATHCSVFVQLCLRRTHLFSGVEGSIQSVTEAKGEGLGACPLRAPTILNWRRMMAKSSLFYPANSVLLQVLKMMWHTTKKLQKVLIMFWCN